MGLGWELLDAESLIYSEMELSMDSITHLTSLYSVSLTLPRRSSKN